MAHILIVEDEATLARNLARGLSVATHTVDVVADGEEAIWAIRSGCHEIVILDVMLPRVSGLEVCRRLRAQGNRVPILMLTARDAIEDVVRGLDAGANDYLTKPFAFQELLARVRALLRTHTATTTQPLSAGDLVVDTAAHIVRRDEAVLALSPMEYRLLEILLRHKGTVVSRERLTEALWRGESDPESNALEVHVATLRKKLDPEDPKGWVHTVRGFGYVLREPETDA